MISAVGVLEACAGFAAQVLGSSLGAVFATAEPDDGRRRWRLRIGFEGFPETVAAQLARAEVLLAAADFREVATADYEVTAGPFAELYARMDGLPYLVRAGAPADRAAPAAMLLQQQAAQGPMLVDFGFGRILAGSLEMGEGSWREIGQRLQALGGHAVLEKAPQDFKQRNDVFGPARPEWRLMHRIKEALDPQRVFSPGTMPGRV